MLLQFSFSGLFDSFLLESLILIAAAFLLGYFIRGSASKSKEKKPIKEKEERNPYEQQLMEANNRYQVGLANHEKSVAEFKTKLQAAEDRANTYAGQLVAAKKELDQISNDARQWNSRMAMMREEKDSISEKLRESERKLNSTETRFNELTRQLQALGEAENWHRKNTELTHEKERLKEELQKIKEMIDSRDRRIIDLLSKDALAKDFRNRYDDAQKENGVLHTRIIELEYQVRHNGDVCSQLENEKTNLLQRLAQLQHESHEMQEKLRTLADADPQVTSQHELRAIQIQEELNLLQQRYNIMEKNLQTALEERDGLVMEVQRIRVSKSILTPDEHGESGAAS